MGMFDHFPYTNFHELNLDWILQALKEIEKTMDQFVAINSLKYADPIRWSIIRQYEKNTIVIDPLTGTAYISVKAVPSGVALTNTDYWSVVFDLGSFVVRAAKNFTLRFEEATTLTATMPINEGQWVVWGDTLYKALSNIIAGDQYVIDSNIKRITVEEIKNEIYQTFNNIIGALADLDTTDKSNLVNAINELVNAINELVANQGNLAALTTTVKTSLVSAINELVNDLNAEAEYRRTADNGLSDNIQTLHTNQGNLAALTTTVKTSLVSAINELVNDLNAEAEYRRTADNNLVNAISKREYNFFNKYFLFLGDSYGDEPGEWADLVITDLGLTDRAENLCVGGAAFYHPNPAYQFITQLQNYTGDRSNVTDIIICGGLNDSHSSDPADYANVQSAMVAFNDYVKTEFPYVNVHLGYIGNGNDLDPDSQIGNRTYLARQCCRYVYYDRAGALNWHIMSNVEYALTGSPANIASDGVHPSTYGNQALRRVIEQAIVNNSAEFNYPIYSAGVAATIGTLSSNGNMSFKIHNNVATIMLRNFEITVTAGTSFTSGTNKIIASMTNMLFNTPVNFMATVRLYNVEIDGTPSTTYYYGKCRILLSNNHISLTFLEADGTTLHTFNFASAGSLSIEDIDFSFDSMVLA